MNQIVPKIQIRVKLTKAELAMIDREIIKAGNKQKACIYAGIHFETFTNSLSGSKIKKEQRDKLIEFCELVKQQRAA